MPLFLSTLPTLTNGKDAPVLCDANGRALIAVGNAGVIPGVDANRKAASSGNVANAAAVAALAAVASKTNYITGFILTASGATAALVVNATITGLVGGTLTFTFVFPAGVAVAATPLVVEFPVPIPATAPNTAITLTLPAGGAGNTNAAATITGFDI